METIGNSWPNFFWCWHGTTVVFHNFPTKLGAIWCPYGRGGIAKPQRLRMIQKMSLHQVGRRGSTWVDFGCDLVT